MKIKPTYQELEKELKEIRIANQLIEKSQIVDRAKQNKTEKALIESELRWKFAVEGNSDGLWDWNLITDEVYFSAQWKKMLGFSENEIEGSLQEWDKRVHPDDKKKVYEDINRHINGETDFYENEHRVLCKDNTYKWILDRGKIVSYTSDNKPERMIGTHLDITDRKKAEEIIHIQNQKYQVLNEELNVSNKELDIERTKIQKINAQLTATLNALPDIMFEVDGEGRIFNYYASRPELLYAKPKEFLGKRIDEILPKDAAIICNNAISEAVEKGKHSGATYSLQLPNGLFWFELSIAAKTNNKTLEKHMVMLVRDITDRKNAEKALKERERQLQEAQKIAHLGHWDLDIVNDKLTWSDEVYRIFDLVPQEFGATYESFLANIHPDDRYKVNKAYTNSLKTKLPYEIEHRLLTKSGKIKCVLEKGVTKFDKSGNPLHSFGTVLDITERKKNEEALKTSEEKYRLLAETMKDVVVKISSTGELMYVSPVIEEFGGYKPEEEIGNHISKYFANKTDLQNALKLLADVINTQTSGNFEFLFLRKDKTTLHVELTYVPLIKSGKVYAIQLVIRDITERKNAEQALKVSEERYKRLVNNSNSLITEIDGDSYKIKSCNPAFARMLNKVPEQLVGKNVKELFPSDILQRRIEYGEKALKENKIQIFEDERNGNYFINNFIPVITDERRFIQTVSYDITDRVQLDKSLKASEERFRTVADFAYDWEYWISPKGEMLYVTPSCERITEYSANEFMQNPKLLTSIVHPEDIDNWINHEHRSFDKAVIETIEFRIITKSGEEVWISHVCRTIYNESGENIGIRGSNRDVTEQKLVELAFKVADDRLSKTLIAANDGMWDWDLITNKVYFDSRYYEMAGYAVDEFPYEFDEFQKRIHPDDVENVMIRAQQHIEGKTARFRVEFRFKKKSGDWIWIMGRGLVLERDENNEALRFIGTHTDITERKKAEEALKTSEKKLRAIFENKGTATGIFGEDKIIKTCNTKLVELCGYSKQEIEGKMKWSDLVVKKDLERMQHYHAQRTTKTGIAPIHYECGIIKKNGEKIVCIVNIGLVGKERIASLIDITARKNAEELLKESEEKYRGVIENMIDGFYKADVNGNVVLLSPSVSNIIGFSEEEIIGKPVALFYANPDERNIFLEKIKKIGKVENYLMEFIKKGKNNIFIEANARVVYKDGKYDGIEGVFRDVTERKKVEKELKSRMEELEVFNEISVDRELLVNDLRNEINILLNKSGEENKYDIVQ